MSGFLLSATNPETGKVSYAYTNTMLASKTDAKGQQFTYGYDAYNRLTTIKVNSTLLRTFIYDTNTLDNTGFSQNTLGRLAAVQYPANAQGIQFNDMYSYVAAGTAGASLPAKKRLQVNQALNLSSGPYGTETLNLDATYTYNNEGSVASTTVFRNLRSAAGEFGLDLGYGGQELTNAAVRISDNIRLQWGRRSDGNRRARLHLHLRQRVPAFGPDRARQQYRRLRRQLRTLQRTSRHNLQRDHRVPRL